jgi:hypothetical protein
MKRNPVFVRLTQWEHWPAFVYYIPLLPFFFIRSLKAGHIIFFFIANPGLLYSGNGTESKFKTLGLLPETMKPKSWLIQKSANFDEEVEKFEALGFQFPVIAKPDIGFRGYLVKKINSMAELKSYLKKVNEDIIIQEFIPYEKELGIFYHRIPGEAKGKVTSITIKKFIQVTGDGQNNLSRLIRKDERAFLYYDLFEKIHKEKMSFVYPKGEIITLSVIGNHSKGTQFINGNHLIDLKLENFVDGICNNIEGWYYGRLDIKYESFEKLLQGESFKILEINGIISEPTHIYDASHKDAGFFRALKSINSHWRIMGKIAQKVHRDQGVPYPKVMPLIKNLLWLRSHTKKLKKLNAIEL